AVLLRAHTLSELTLSPPFLPRRLTIIVGMKFSSCCGWFCCWRICVAASL
ncbi:hypothetical protein HN873_062667, partial [Arachis hypogaea]